MSRLVDKVFEKQLMNLENSNFELTEKKVRLQISLETVRKINIEIVLSIEGQRLRITQRLTI